MTPEQGRAADEARVTIHRIVGHEMHSPYSAADELELSIALSNALGLDTSELEVLLIRLQQHETGGAP